MLELDCLYNVKRNPTGILVKDNITNVILCLYYDKLYRFINIKGNHTAVITGKLLPELINQNELHTQWGLMTSNRIKYSDIHIIAEVINPNTPLNDPEAGALRVIYVSEQANLKALSRNVRDSDTLAQIKHHLNKALQTHKKVEVQTEMPKKSKPDLPDNKVITITGVVTEVIAFNNGAQYVLQVTIEIPPSDLTQHEPVKISYERIFNCLAIYQQSRVELDSIISVDCYIDQNLKLVVVPPLAPKK